LIGNDAAFAMPGITEADTQGNRENDWAKGHCWENGIKPGGSHAQTTALPSNTSPTRDIQVWGTVFEGNAHPIANAIK
tara:strand:+ start:56343 stop:56576 length:234 start_codon:yes stop_codon:yes gene_type:complete